ncbi:hypothetical protein [Enterobacter hormaechei]
MAIRVKKRKKPRGSLPAAVFYAINSWWFASSVARSVCTPFSVTSVVGEN